MGSILIRLSNISISISDVFTHPSQNGSWAATTGGCHQKDPRIPSCWGHQGTYNQCFFNHQINEVLSYYVERATDLCQSFANTVQWKMAKAQLDEDFAGVSPCCLWNTSNIFKQLFSSCLLNHAAFRDGPYDAGPPDCWVCIWKSQPLQRKDLVLRSPLIPCL